jgi:glutathione S-transferase
MPVLSILYSFRRCPYAMRARLALDASEQPCELREIILRNKPEEMLQVSPKGTVPVLVDTDGTVIDESLDIMLWALERNDPEQWLVPDEESREEIFSLIRHFDLHFKHHLDRYKYPSRYEGADALVSRGEAGMDIQRLEATLARTRCLCGERIALADMAIAPFVRQFANVDAAWFASEPWPGVHCWLGTIVASERFERVMRSFKTWIPGTQGVRFPAEDSHQMFG